MRYIDWPYVLVLLLAVYFTNSPNPVTYWIGWILTCVYAILGGWYCKTLVREVEQNND